MVKQRMRSGEWRRLEKRCIITETSFYLAPGRKEILHKRLSRQTHNQFPPIISFTEKPFKKLNQAFYHKFCKFQGNTY